MTAAHVLIYIHGFSSSPASWKARTLQHAFKDLTPHLLDTPELPFSPQAAIELLQIRIEHYLSYAEKKTISLVASSLGGYYAIYLAQHYDLKAVLVNPAVRPFELLENYLGENHNYHTGESFGFEPHHIDELKRFDVPHIQQPERFLLLLQTGDVVLDYRQALAKFPQSPTILEQGGSHGFDGFERMIPSVLNFIGIDHRNALP
jgi:predicted esterase YcpF (UPF0227 family)